MILKLIRDAWQDLRFAARTLPKMPAFTLTAVLSIALGIGATTAVFSVADAWVFRPVPVPRAAALVTISGSAPDRRSVPDDISYPDYLDIRKQSKTTEDLVAFTYLRVGAATTSDAVPQLRQAMAVNGTYFHDLQVEPTIGRAFSEEEGSVQNGVPVVVISNDLWKRLFVSDRNIIGQKFWLSSVEFTIIGVTPEKFIGTDPIIHPDIYFPIVDLPLLVNWGKSAIEDRGKNWFTVKGRLRQGSSLDEAAAEMATFGRQFAAAYPDTHRNRELDIRTELRWRGALTPQYVALSAMMLGLSVLVLCAACANVASLLLGRSITRARETAIRISLGAKAERIVRQLLVENLVIALIGGILGLVMGQLGVKYLATLISFSTELPQYLSFQMDARVLGIAALATILSCILFGLVPALRSTKVDLVPALKASESTPRRGRLKGRSLLVIVQVALALTLLCGESIFIRTFQSMATSGPGFRTDHLAMISLDPSLVRYTPDQTARFYKTLVERARELPGVTDAALTQMVPTEFIPFLVQLVPEGFVLPPGETTVRAPYYTVGDRYFEVIGTPIIRGRGFRVTDDAASPRVAVVNELFASAYWPNQDAIGKRFRLNGADGPSVEIVGIAALSWYAFVGENRGPFVYLPWSQRPEDGMTLLVQTALPDAGGIVHELLQLVSSIDRHQPVFNIRTMSTYYQQQSLQTLRAIIRLVGIMSTIGVCLALIGLFALATQSAKARTREIGIRMAIGARRPDILLLVLRQGTLLIIVGMCLGVAGGFGLANVVKSLSSSLRSQPLFDPWTFIVAPLAFTVIAIAAIYQPAFQATQTDVSKTLRYD